MNQHYDKVVPHNVKYLQACCVPKRVLVPCLFGALHSNW